ncbi:MAG: chorismate synthase [Spirochaetota bacterium]
MPGSSFGRIYRITTFGESHGRGVGVVVDGVPPGVSISEDDVQQQLDRRRPGQSRVTTPRNEPDRVEILSGVFEGKTQGTPVALYIRNTDINSSQYQSFKNLYRPGHADYPYQQKYGTRDWRGGGRASGRETAARVAAGAIARKIILGEGIRITGYTLEIAGVRAEERDFSAVETNMVRCPDPQKADQMVQKIERAGKEGDSVGGVIEVVVQGAPAGLGDPVFDKLEALLGHAVLSIGAVRAVEFGCGFESSGMKGSEYNDPYYVENGRIKTRTNNAGGTLGGISTGQPIVVRAAVRPPASIARPQTTVDTEGNTHTLNIRGRHDPCIVPRIIPVAEAMVAMVILDCLLVQGVYKNIGC